MNQPTESEFLDDFGLKKPDRSALRKRYNRVKTCFRLGRRMKIMLEWKNEYI
jgi:hypothetical protein